MSLSESEGSVTLWIKSLKTGDQLAASSLWRRYFDTLVRVARGRLRNAPRTVSDEEDVALAHSTAFAAARRPVDSLSWRIEATFGGS